MLRATALSRRARSRVFMNRDFINIIHNNDRENNDREPLPPRAAPSRAARAGRPSTVKGFARLRRTNSETEGPPLPLSLSVARVGSRHRRLPRGYSSPSLTGAIAAETPPTMSFSNIYRVINIRVCRFRHIRHRAFSKTCNPAQPELPGASFFHSSIYVYICTYKYDHIKCPT